MRSRLPLHSVIYLYGEVCECVGATDYSQFRLVMTSCESFSLLWTETMNGMNTIDDVICPVDDDVAVALAHRRISRCFQNNVVEVYDGWKYAS